MTTSDTHAFMTTEHANSLGRALASLRRYLLSAVALLVGLQAFSVAAQVTYVDSTSADGDKITSLAVPRPAGIQVGDLLVGYVATYEANAGIAGPAGWTEQFEVANGNLADLGLFYKVAAASDTGAGTFTFTMANDQEVVAGVLVYRGIDTVSPIVAHATSLGTGTTAVAPNVDAGGNTNTRVVRAVAWSDNNNLITSPPGTLERIDRERGGKGGGVSLTIADAEKVTSGNTGTATFSAADDRAYVVSTFVFRSPQEPTVTMNLEAITATPITLPGTADYRVTITNTDTTSDLSATGVVVSNTLPTGFTYSAGSIATSGTCTRTTTSNPTVGQSTLSWGTWTMAENCTITIDYTVDISLASPLGVISDDIIVSGTNFTTITDDGTATDEDVTLVCGDENLFNTASVVSETDDIDPSNNSSSVCVTFIPDPELIVVKTDSPDPVRRGENLVYTLAITNTLTSAIPATNVVLEDNLPAGITWISTQNSNGGGTCVVGNLVACNCAQPGNTGTVQCQVGDLAIGETKTVIITTRVD